MNEAEEKGSEITSRIVTAIGLVAIAAASLMLGATVAVGLFSTPKSIPTPNDSDTPRTVGSVLTGERLVTETDLGNAKQAYLPCKYADWKATVSRLQPKDWRTTDAGDQSVHACYLEFRGSPHGTFELWALGEPDRIHTVGVDFIVEQAKTKREFENAIRICAEQFEKHSGLSRGPLIDWFTTSLSSVLTESKATYHPPDSIIYRRVRHDDIGIELCYTLHDRPQLSLAIGTRRLHLFTESYADWKSRH